MKAQLRALFQETLSTDVAAMQKAGLQIIEAQKQPGYLLASFDILAQETDPTVALVAATQLDDKPEIVIAQQERHQLISNILKVMSTATQLVQSQLMTTVELMASTSYPLEWPNLVKELGTLASIQSPAAMYCGIETAHNVFAKYRLLEATPAVEAEFGVVLTHLQECHLNVMKTARSLPGNDGVELAKSCAELFLDFNAMTIPEFYEDHLNEWMELFTYYFTNVQADMIPLTNLRAIICDCLNHYVNHYFEEFKPFFSIFVTQIWTLLISVPSESEYNAFAVSALKFLSSVADCERSDLFESEDTLTSLVEKAVLNNIQLSEEDMEIFEDEPTTYFRNDIESGDGESRRDAACKLLHALNLKFGARLSNIALKFIVQLLQNYASDPAANYKSKFVAVSMMMAIGAKTKTPAKGAVLLFEGVDIPQFFAQAIIPDLKNSANCHPVLLTVYIKYVVLFRPYISKSDLMAVLALLVSLLKSPNVALHTYAAYCFDILLKMTGDNKAPTFTLADISPLAGEAMTNVTEAIESTITTENPHLAAALLRLTAIAGSSAAEFASHLIAKFSKFLETSIKNPLNAHFRHNLFETIACLVSNVCKSNPAAVANFEALLFPPLKAILGMDLPDFIPYVLQILSLLLNLRQGPITPEYSQLLPPLLNKEFWQPPGNAAGLYRFIRSALAKDAANMISQGYLNTLIGPDGIFLSLILVHKNTQTGFNLLGACVEFCPLPQIQALLTQDMHYIFSRFSQIKSKKIFFGLQIITFVARFISTYGPEAIVQLMDSVKPGMLAMVLTKIVATRLNSITGPDARTCVVGFGRWLTSPLSASPAYSNAWMPIMSGLVKMLGDANTYAAVKDGAVGTSMDFSAAFEPLSFAEPVNKGDIQGGNLNPLLKEAVTFAAKNLNITAEMVFNQLSPEAKPLFQKMMMA